MLKFHNVLSSCPEFFSGRDERIELYGTSRNQRGTALEVGFWAIKCRRLSDIEASRVGIRPTSIPDAGLIERLPVQSFRILDGSSCGGRIDVRLREGSGLTSVLWAFLDKFRSVAPSRICASLRSPQVTAVAKTGGE